MTGRGARRLGERVLRDRSGGVLIVAALMLPVALFCLAIVIDLAVYHLDRRKAQATVDVAAIVAAQNLHAAEDAARDILALNGVAAISETEFGRLSDAAKVEATTRPRYDVARGRYAPAADVDPSARFVAGAAPYNAARVTLRQEARGYFAPGMMKNARHQVSAIASAEAVAAFSVGSRLAALREGVVNQLLGALLGGSVSLSLLDYEALLDADVSLFGYLDALALELGLTSGRYQDVLASRPTLAEALNALARVSHGEGAGRAGQALSRLDAAARAGARRIQLAGVIDLGPYGEVAVGADEARGMPARARVLDLLLAEALVANGERFLDLDLTAGAPGLASLSVRIAVGEVLQHSPWIRIGVDREVVSNVQIRLQFSARLLGEGPLKAIAVRVPVYVEIARAEARLGAVRCRGRKGGAEVDLLVRPGLADLFIGEADLSRKITRASDVAPALLVSAPAIRATGRARATIDNLAETRITFTEDDIARGRFRRASTQTLLASLLRSLGRDLVLDVEIAGLALGLGPLVRPALQSAVGEALGALDAPLFALLELLGVAVGEADVRVNGVRCDRSVLVQ